MFHVINYTVIYPSHTGQTDTKPTSNRQKSSNSGRNRFTIGIDFVFSVWCRFMFRQTNLSGRDLSNMFERSIFQTCLKDLSSTNCRLSVGYMSVWCRFCRGAFGDVSVSIRPPMVDGLSVLDRLCIGHMSTDLTPIQGRFKTESSPTWNRIAWSWPTHFRIKTDECPTYLEPKPNVNR